LPPGGLVASTGAPMAQDATVVMGTPIVTTAAGFPVVSPAQAVSAAVTAYDGWSGIKSCDARVQHDLDEIMLYFNTHNTRPLLGCRCHGWHRERRTREVTERRNGNTRTRTEHYWVTVTDFDYKVDLTPFIFPYGYIASVDENNLTVPQLLAKFVDDDNLLKSLAMHKEVAFDYAALRGMVHGYLRSLGWRRGLTISFPKANHTVRVYHENWLSRLWEDACCNVLCHLTLLPCVVLRLYRGDCNCQGGGHKEEDIRSYFRIEYAPLQVFEAIRPRLWCPGYSGIGIAMEMLRDVFW